MCLPASLFVQHVPAAYACSSKHLQMASVHHQHRGDDDDGTSSFTSSMGSEPPALDDGYDSWGSGAWDDCQNDGYDDLLRERERCYSSVPADSQDGCTIMNIPVFKSCVSLLQAIYKIRFCERLQEVASFPQVRACHSIGLCMEGVGWGPEFEFCTILPWCI